LGEGLVEEKVFRKELTLVMEWEFLLVVLWAKMWVEQLEAG
jgi:hypothetical protein